LLDFFLLLFELELQLLSLLFGFGLHLVDPVLQLINLSLFVFQILLGGLKFLFLFGLPLLILFSLLVVLLNFLFYPYLFLLQLARRLLSLL